MKGARKQPAAASMESELLRFSFSGLTAFIAVVEERSFTRAAARIGVSQSAISHSVRGLESELGAQLLARNARGVVPTEAGERLFRGIAPRFKDIDSAIVEVSELRDSPTGTIRISAPADAIRTILAPRVAQLLRQHPGISIELHADNSLVDIVADGFDAGVRLGDAIAQDMIAVRIGPDMKFSLVASPEYFAAHAPPKKPGDLVDHSCINIRLPTHQGLWPWEFEKAGRTLNIRVQGRLICNDIYDCIDGAVAHLGIAYVPAVLILQHLADGRLVQALSDWSPPWPGYHLYYPSRRQPSGAMALLIASLRQALAGS